MSPSPSHLSDVFETRSRVGSLGRNRRAEHDPTLAHWRSFTRDPPSLHASVGSTEVANGVVARFGVIDV